MNDTDSNGESVDAECALRSLDVRTKFEDAISGLINFHACKRELRFGQRVTVSRHKLLRTNVCI